MINFNINKNSTQSGRSMIEMLGVLAIVGVLSVGGIAGYSKAMTKFKINKTADQISHTLANIQTLYAQQTTYEGLDYLIYDRKSEIIKVLFSNMDLNNTNIPMNPFNGGYELENDYPNELKLILTGLPKEACIALSTQDWGASLPSLVALSIAKGNNITQDADDRQMIPVDCKESFETRTGYVACSDNLPIPVATAAKYCNNPDDQHILKITIKK